MHEPVQDATRASLANRSSLTQVVPRIVPCSEPEPASPTIVASVRVIGSFRILVVALAAPDLCLEPDHGQRDLTA
jgi:hypothetical protein